MAQDENITPTHAVLTGPISGSVTLEDGTKVDVSGEVVMVESPEQAAEVAQKIGERYEAEGHPNVPVSEENPEGFVLRPPPSEE